jgi:chitinase
MLNPITLRQLKNPVEDDASLMPDLSGQNLLVGYWQNWASTPGQGCQGGRFAEFALSDIDPAYNVIVVAFMKGAGIPTFEPYIGSPEEFRRQIGILNGQGRAVLISLGGANAQIELRRGEELLFAYEIIRLVENYGFDGLDIDLEHTALTAADNPTVIPAALRMVKDYYKDQGLHFIISMAPEFPNLVSTGSYQPYLPYLRELDGYYDFIAPQYYNQGGAGVEVDGIGTLRANDDATREDFLYYLTDSLVTGTRGYTQIPHDKFAIGLPSNPDAAHNGYVVDPQSAIRALARLERAGHPIRGLMTWSASWDDGFDAAGRAYGWQFARRYGYLTADGQSSGGDSGAQPAAWESGVNYALNDLVSYQDNVYFCLRAHMSTPDWTPTETIDVLWADLQIQPVPC